MTPRPLMVVHAHTPCPVVTRATTTAGKSKRPIPPPSSRGLDLETSDKPMATTQPAGTRPRRWTLGPGLLVTAAFIGPGTVTTASLAGANHGFALLWVIVLAILATMILQSMAARLGLVTRKGLGQTIMEANSYPGWRLGVGCLVLLAIGLGNSAYQAGNLTGAGLGLEILTGQKSAAWPIVIGVVSGLILLLGRYQRIERALILLVGAMSLGFVLTALLTRPNPVNVVAGLWPHVPTSAWLTLPALVGTTLVPYNLFLHASMVQEKWGPGVPLPQALDESRWDTRVSIGLGGVVSVAILSTAATAALTSTGPVVTIHDLAIQLDPLLGPRWGRFLFGLGLFAAGTTSAITAPMAAAMTINSVFGWSSDLHGPAFRTISLSVVAIGTAVAVSLNKSPIQLLVIAQATNAALLPLIVVFLIVALNRQDKDSKLGLKRWENVAAALIFILTVLLSVRLFYSFLSN